MKLRGRYIAIAFSALVALAFASCISENSVSNKEREKISLDAWIRLHKPELEGNRQEEGGYYVEVLEWGGDETVVTTENELGNAPIMEQDTCWVYYNIVGRDMNGRICLTRDGSLADLCGTFSYSTHYVPFFNYAGSQNQGLLEGTYLAMRHEITLSEEYRAKLGKSEPFYLRRGSKVRLYLPSSIAYGESGSTAEGGYEGQYSLDANRSMIMEIEVKSVIKNPSEKELDMVDAFTDLDGWTQAEKAKKESDDDDEDDILAINSGSGDATTDTTDDDKLKGLYYRLGFNPKSTNVAAYRYVVPEKMGIKNPYRDTKKYADIDALNKKINEILLERFGEGVAERNDKTKVDINSTINVWYVLRFMDGYVLDSNIKEVRELVFDDRSGSETAYQYRHADSDPDSDDPASIAAWYYAIPYMHYGAYGEIVTTSAYAYGSVGITGSTTTDTTTTTTPEMAYNNYYNYYNYYNNYYYGYNNYYNYYNYNYYANPSTSGETITTTTISTEVLPYTPLVFTIFVEEE